MNFTFLILLTIFIIVTSQEFTEKELEELFKTDCRQIQDKLKCSESKFCTWSNWKPQRCSNKCSQFNGFKDQCVNYFHCQFDDEKGTCYSRSCGSCPTEEICSYNTACAWSEADSQCKDESCLTQLAQMESECPTSYCLWHEQRKLCYDKFCEDYFVKYSCLEISFCEWHKYRCIHKNFDKKLLS